MRLIDAIAYRKVLNEEMDYQLEHCKDSFKYRCGLEIAIADLGDMPTIDAVPVVRCKDCAWRGTAGCPYNAFDRRVERPDNGFCSDGERKENKYDPA